MFFKKKSEFSGHNAGIYSLAFDGEYIYSASADKFVTRWDIQTGIQDKFAIKFDSAVYSILLFNTNKFLACGLSNGDLHIFDLVTRNEIKFFTQHRTSLFAIHENKIKQHIYCGDASGNISVWKSNTLELELFLPLNAGKIRRIVSNKGGDKIALAGQDGILRIFDTEFFNEIGSFEAHEGGVTTVLFHPLNENLIFTGGKDALLKLWNFKKGELIISIPAHNYVIYDLITMNKDKALVSVSRDKTIKVWNLNDITFHQRIESKDGGHRHSINSAIKLDDSTFVTGSDDKRIIIWVNEG